MLNNDDYILLPDHDGHATSDYIMKLNFLRVRAGGQTKAKPKTL